MHTPCSRTDHDESDGPHLLPLSARHPDALAALARSYAQWLSRPDSPALRDICHSAATARSHHNHRLAVVANGTGDAVAELLAFADGGRVESGHSGKTSGRPDRGCVFVFTGMGPQWWRMGVELLQSEPAFATAAHAVDEEFRELAGWSVLDEMRRDQASSRIHEAQVAQPANFLLQMALAELLRTWGVRPGAIVGHSAGEVAAACVAGMHDLRAGVRVIYHRSRLQQLATGKGRMLAVGLGLDAALALIAGREKGVAIAAHNSASSVALSGSVAILDEIAAGLEKQAVFNRFLHGDVPYHSPEMDPLMPELSAALADVRSRRPEVPLYSSVFGRLVVDESFDAAYWCSNIRQPVLFAEATERLLGDGYSTFLEVGPHPVLSMSIKDVMRQQQRQGDVFACMVRERPESATIRRAVAALYTTGHEVTWRALSHTRARRVKLPTYPWQRERLWFEESRESKAYRFGRPDHPLLGTRLSHPTPSWESDVASSALSYLSDHIVDDTVVFPGAGYVEIGLAVQKLLEATESAVIEDIEFRQALVVAPGSQQLVRTWFDDMSREYRVCSRPDETSDWVVHAKGRLVQSPPLARKRMALDTLRQQCGESVATDVFYERLASAGLQYGPAFRGVKRLWRAQGEAFAELAPAASSDSSASGHRLHPALLDAAIQSLVATIVDASPVKKRPFVPVAIRRARFFSQSSGPWYSHARLTALSDATVVGDIVLLDSTGDVLAELSGIQCRALPAADQSGASFDALTYAAEWVREDLPAPAAVGAGRWIIFADERGIGARLAAELVSRHAGLGVDLVPRETIGHRGSVDQFARRLDGVPDLDRVVYLWATDERHSPDLLRSEATVGVLHLVQALARLNGSRPPRLDVITQGAQQADTTEMLAGLAQTGVIGLARTSLTEHPELRCHLIDVDASWDSGAVTRLADELLADSPETEVALRSAGRFVYRLRRSSIEPPKADSPLEPTLTATQAAAFRLRSGRPGRMEALQFHEVDRRPPRAGEVEIAVRAAALNFKDVLKVTGLLPAKAVEHTFHGQGLGMEAAGVISAVGEGVSDHKVGDAVVVSGRNCFASHITAPVDQLFAIRKLDSMSFAEAASVPVTFMTSFYGLHELARLRAGETVLIHAAAGGVGLAALQVARWLGARVIATAGSEQKRAYVRSLGVEHVLASRTLDFADEVMALTGGRGVDVVLNSLSGEALLKSLSVMAPLGRFVEIGKRDIIENARLPMLAFNANLSLIAIDLDRIMAEQPERIRGLFEDVWTRFRAGDFTPTPVETFKASQIGEAFRHMAQSKQIGKIVVSFEDDADVCVVPRPPARGTLRGDATYVISGGCGGFGLEIAKWMATAGARHLVLLGRTGARTSRAQDAIRELEQRGVGVTVGRVDVADEDQVRDFLSSLRDRPPLRGVVHAAGVLDDALMLNLDSSRMARVIAPKAQGAWNLHSQTMGLPLDFFVMCSSISSLVGNPGQAAYVAANAYLDALAHHRRAMGLPATSINWGALSEVGMAADNQETLAHLARAGMTPIAPDDAVRALGMALERDVTQIAIVDLEWQKWHQVVRFAAEAPKFAGLGGDGADAGGAGANPLRALLLESAPHDRIEIATLVLAELIGEATRQSADRIDPQASLLDLGIDSLMAMEVQMGIEARFGVHCSVLDLQKGDGIKGLAQRLLARMALPDPSVH